MSSTDNGSEHLPRPRHGRTVQSWAEVKRLARRSSTRMAASASLLAVLAVLIMGSTFLRHGLFEPLGSFSMVGRAVLASAVLAFTGIWLAVAVLGYLRQSDVGPRPAAGTAEPNGSSQTATWDIHPSTDFRQP